MASRSSIAALLRCRSAAARLPASGERGFLPSSASAPLSSRSAVPAVSSSSPATRASPAFSILKGLRVRGGRGEVMAQSGTGGPVRGYHALSASASALPALRASRATLSSSSAARHAMVTRLGLIVVAVVGGVWTACLFKSHRDLVELKRRLGELKRRQEELKHRLGELKRRVDKLEEQVKLHEQKVLELREQAVGM